MVLNNKLYTILKWILATAIAPTITLITGLGELYKFDTTIIVGTISLIASFLGAILGISNYNYMKGDETVSKSGLETVEITGEVKGDEEQGIEDKSQSEEA